MTGEKLGRRYMVYMVPAVRPLLPPPRPGPGPARPVPALSDGGGASPPARRLRAGPGIRVPRDQGAPGMPLSVPSPLGLEIVDRAVCTSGAKGGGAPSSPCGLWRDKELLPELRGCLCRFSCASFPPP